ncbi:MAG: SPOR domain-containing protein [Sulfitobacter sp.]|nr:SPOR domain-containing protein [Sulfitobacter sp.]
MAEMTGAPSGAAGAYPEDAQPMGAAAPHPVATFANVAGAIVSLALLIGVGIWGYKLLVRDVTGSPVVRAASGEMRVRPENPGGQLAAHQGLSVNQVAAEGSAGQPADELRLAPEPVDLLPEDHLVTTAIEQPAPLASDDPDMPTATPDVAAALQSGNVDELVAQLTAGVAPIGNPSDGEEEVRVSVSDSVVAEVSAAERQVAAVLDAPGVRQSLRPRKRPADLSTVVQASFTAVPDAPAQTEEIDPSTLPKGTRLAQLGAFDSPEVAREQWGLLSKRFEGYMGDKARVVQKAQSGGRTFYRLRVHGFADIGEARRFCSALVAENADCIPVVTR